MGASSMFMEPKYKTNKSFYENYLKENLWDKYIKVLSVSFVSSRIYQLLEKTDENGEKEIFIGLTTVSRQRGEIIYKTETESMGPYYTDCPLKYIRQSTCQSENAIEWHKN